MNEQLTVDDAIICLAASVVDRTRDLIQDGWVKGTMATGFQKVEAFCIHGAMNLALAEVFGSLTQDRYTCQAVEAIATAFIVDEAASQYGFKGSWKNAGIPAAGFNDAPSTQHEDVLKVLGGATKRLWSIGLDTQDSEAWMPSKWAEVEVNSDEAKQLLYAQLS